MRRDPSRVIPKLASPKRGFSIIELLVAMMLVAIGMLALVGANTVLVRRRNEARRRLAAATAAANRLAQLANDRCAALSGSAIAQPGLIEQWRVVPRANATREIVDSVQFGDRPVHTLVLRTRLPC